MRERSSTTMGDSNAETPRPFALTWGLSEEYEKLFSFQKIRSAAPELETTHGLVEAYVCRACGTTELFTRDPESIPIGPEYGTELLSVPETGYR